MSLYVLHEVLYQAYYLNLFSPVTSGLSTLSHGSTRAVVPAPHCLGHRGFRVSFEIGSVSHPTLLFFLKIVLDILVS